MIIESINSALPVEIEFNNRPVLTGIYKQPNEATVSVTQRGIAGDTIVDKAVHGGADQAIYIYHVEDYQWWSEQLGKDLDYGTFGENLTVSGVQEVDWVIGDRLFFGDVEFEISAPRGPCFKLGVRMGDSGFVKQFIQACRPGAYARVIKEGTLDQGDQGTIVKAPDSNASVKEVFTEWHKKDKSVDVLRRALDSPIAAVHREQIQAWYNELA